MKALVITGSRADRNCQNVVHQALNDAGHDGWWENLELGPLDALTRRPDVAIVAGDRHEILEACVYLSLYRIPIAHISGGDVTIGSADDRYRDAITALACIHLTETDMALKRLMPCTHHDDFVLWVGCPGIDRIKQTPLLSAPETFDRVGLSIRAHNVIVCVHPNTIGPDPHLDFHTVLKAVMNLEGAAFAFIGANADNGGEQINAYWRDFGVSQNPGSCFHENLEPQLFYSLMQHCDAMIGNSSSMLTEAPCFDLPCVLVGDRQNGRPLGSNVYVPDKGESVINALIIALEGGRDHIKPCTNPYGDGNAGPSIVKALEENAWRWSK